MPGRVERDSRDRADRLRAASHDAAGLSGTTDRCPRRAGDGTGNARASRAARIALALIAADRSASNGHGAGGTHTPSKSRPRRPVTPHPHWSRHRPAGDVRRTGAGWPRSPRPTRPGP